MADEIRQITIDVMEAINRHQPDIFTVAQTLTEILSGALLQIEKGPARNKLREMIIQHINAEEDETDAVDLTDQLSKTH